MHYTIIYQNYVLLIPFSFALRDLIISKCDLLTSYLFPSFSFSNILWNISLQEHCVLFYCLHSCMSSFSTFIYFFLPLNKLKIMDRSFTIYMHKITKIVATHPFHKNKKEYVSFKIVVDDVIPSTIMAENFFFFFNIPLKIFNLTCPSI